MKRLSTYGVVPKHPVVIPQGRLDGEDLAPARRPAAINHPTRIDKTVPHLFRICFFILPHHVLHPIRQADDRHPWTTFDRYRRSRHPRRTASAEGIGMSERKRHEVKGQDGEEEGESYEKQPWPLVLELVLRWAPSKWSWRRHV